MSNPDDDLNTLRDKLNRLQQEHIALLTEINRPSDGGLSLAEAKLKILSHDLTQEVKTDFFDSVKHGLWIAAFLAAIATAGGFLTLSDLLKSAIESAVDGKRKEIEKMRESIIDALVAVKLEAATAHRDVEKIKSELESAKTHFDSMRKSAEEQVELAEKNYRGLNSAFSVRFDSSGKNSATSSVSNSPNNVTKVAGDTAKLQENWLRALPSGFVGIAGSTFSQTGMESTYDGVLRGDFSYIFQKSLSDPNADTNHDSEISFYEAFATTRNIMKRSTPIFSGDDKTTGIFSITNIVNRKLLKRRVFTLLIGINTYKTAPLAGPVNDITAFSSLLKGKRLISSGDAYTIKLLNDQATQKNIYAAISDLQRLTTTNDIVVFYFTGHQTQVPKINVSGNEIERVLLPYDFEEANVLFIDDLANALRKVPAKLRVVIADV